MFGKRKNKEEEQPKEKLTVKEKLARLRRSLTDLCVTVRTDCDVSLRRSPDAAPEKTYRFGTDRTVKLVGILWFALAVAAATAAALLAIRTAFELCVNIEAGRRRRK